MPKPNAASSSREAPDPSATTRADALVITVGPLALARALKDAVCHVPEVAAVASGSGTEAATYGPHEKVTGVVVRSAEGVYRVDVHIIAVYSATLSLPRLAAEVRTVVYRIAADVGASILPRVDIVVDDLWFGEATER